MASEWELRHDHSSGQAYYLNLVTGESSWEVPAELNVLPAADVEISSAPPWTEAADDAGRVYYVNLTTMETSWDPPQGFHHKAIGTAAARRPSTAEQMDQLNALLSGGDGDDGDERDEGQAEEDHARGGPIGVEIPSSQLIAGDPPATDGSEWMMFLNELNGVPYYYNHLTFECVWEPPAAFLAYHHLDMQSEDDVRDGDADQLGFDDAGVSRRSTPTAAAPLPPHTPATPIQITPEFEEKVRRAIEAVSKTPVGSSRLLLVRTPTIKSIDSSRPPSRPTSSSGASARQRLATTRVVSESDVSPPPAELKPSDVSDQETSAPQEFYDDDIPEASVVAPDPVDRPPSNEELEQLQRDTMMRYLVFDAMALTIQCMVRCVHARHRVARKRAERQLMSMSTERVSKEIFDASTPEECGIQPVAASEQIQSTFASEIIPAQPPDTSSESLQHLPSRELLHDETVQAREEFPCVHEGDRNDEKDEPFAKAAAQDGHEQPVIPESDLEDTLVESVRVGVVGPTLVPDKSPPSAVIESIPTEEIPVSETDGDPFESAVQDASALPSAITVNGFEPTGTRHDAVSAGQVEALAGVPTESREMLAASIHDEQTVVIRGDIQVNRLDHHEASAEESSALSVPLVIGGEDLSPPDGTQAKPPGQETPVGSSSSRTNSRTARSSRRAHERPSSPTTRLATVTPLAVDTSSGRLAVLNITTIFPPNPHRDRIKVMPSKPLASENAATMAGHIQRKPIPIHDNDRHGVAVASKPLEQRDRERADRAEAGPKMRDEARAKWTQEVNQCRHIFAAATVRRTRNTRDLQIAEEERRQCAADERKKWLKDQTTIWQPADETKELKSDHDSGGVAGVQSAMQPHGFIEAMMHERLRNIHHVLERLQISRHPKHDLCEYWQQLVHSFPSSLKEGVQIDDPYWAKLHAKLYAMATTSSQDLAMYLTRHRTDSFDSLLHGAAWRGDVEMVQYLVSELHADVYAIDCSATKTTPLHEACRGGHLPVVDFLLSRGAFLDAIDSHGETPLHVACRLGWGQVVHALITAGHTQDESDASKKTMVPDGIEPEPPVDDVRVLHVLSWGDCFHLRNGKHRRAMEIATLPSLVEFLTQYAKNLQSRLHDASSSTNDVAAHTRAVVKKKRTKP